MITIQDYTVCYHGTIRHYGEYIVNHGVEFSRSRPQTDFGQGFYVTNNLAQAQSWAIRKHLDYRNIISSLDNKPVVLCFHLNTFIESRLNGLTFLEPDLKWASFIAHSRNFRTVSRQ